MKKIRIFDIAWDLYDEETGRELSPKEVGVPDHIDLEVEEGNDVAEAVEEFLDHYVD